jgi:transcriptional regulator of acetoin/glycerol metabolism
MQWIEGNLGTDYPWPGNYRELEQCIKNVLIRRNYRPSRAAADDPLEEFSREARAGRISVEDLVSRYVTIVYSQTGSYEETARRLGLDRRTVKAKVDTGLLKKLRG